MTKTFLLIFIAAALFLGAESFKFKQSKNIPIRVIENEQGCNITHLSTVDYMYWTQHNLMNKTIDKMNEQTVILPNVTWQKNSSVTYVIYDAKPSFTLSEDQTASYATKNSILIDDFYAKVTINFKWLQIVNGYTKNGTGLAQGTSEQLSVYLSLDANDGTFKLGLLDYLKYTLTLLTLKDIDNWVTSQQKSDIQQLLNWNTNGSTLKQQLLKFVDSIYGNSLKSAIADENKRIGSNFSYKWVSPSTGQHIINFTRTPKVFYADKDNTTYGYEARVDGYNKNKCGPQVPLKPYYYNPEEYISYTFMENIINYSIQKGILDVKLNSTLWPTKSFSFRALDVYSLISNTQQFSADLPVEGYCRGQSNVTKVNMTQNYDWIAVYGYNCQVFIKQTNILNFYIEPTLSLGTSSLPESFNIIAMSANVLIDLKPVTGFELFNKEGLKNIILTGFKQNMGKPLFGSGFPQYLYIQKPRTQILPTTLLYFS